MARRAARKAAGTAKNFEAQAAAKAKLMQKTWEEASLKRETRLPLDFKFEMKVPKGVSKSIKEQISTELAAGLYRAIPALEVALTNAMDSKVWGWSGADTLRKSGEVAKDPRDIIDMGVLADSLAIEVTDLVLFVSYSAPYAAIIHNGGVTHNGGVIQARPWVQATLIGGGPVEQVNWKELLLLSP